jgi:glycosyltransferase involved in cell wall biosynthesis
VRFLLVNNHCITNPTAGVTQSLRTMIGWLAEAGHPCHIVTTARFESPVTFTIDDHLTGLGVVAPLNRVVRYATGGVPISLLLTRHHDESRPDPAETAEFLTLVEQLLDSFVPDQVIASSGHPMIQAAVAQARSRGITTAFAVRGYGYDDPRYFEDVDHVFTCSQYLTDVYRDMIGLVSTPLEPPIDWSTVLAPTESRAFVTFVHPAPHKGLMVFARLADMLGSRRPDIPVMVVQSGRSAGALNAIPGIDFRRYPQIMAAPPVQHPADYFSLTRILLVPSVWEEPFGRVAAEAMINGIPSIVSDRGSLPQVVGGDIAVGGGGRVLPIPRSLTPRTLTLPSESDVEPWYEAVCTLWDDPTLYESVAARARELAESRYSERVSRTRHVDYFTSLRPGGQPIPPIAPSPAGAAIYSYSRV